MIRKGLAVCAALTTAGLMLSGGAAQAATPATTTVPYLCRTTDAGGWVPINGHTRQYESSAPAAMPIWRVFTVSLDPAPATTNASYIASIKDVQVVYRLPDNAVVIGLSLSGGSGLGPGTPWVTIAGKQLTITAPGPIAGGTTYDFPKLDLKLFGLAPGDATIGTGGSSFEQPSFAHQRLGVGETEWGPVQCYADPAQPVTFTSTMLTS